MPVNVLCLNLDGIYEVVHTEFSYAYGHKTMIQATLL